MKRSLGMAMIPGKHLVSCEAETKDWTVDRVGNEGKAGEPQTPVVMPDQMRPLAAAPMLARHRTHPRMWLSAQIMPIFD